MDVRTVLGAVWRQRLIAVTVLIAMAVAVAVGLYYAPRSYTATATVSAATSAEGSAAESDLESLRATLGELADSTDVLEEVRADLSVVRTLDELQAEVSGQWIQGTILVKVTVEDRNPVVAAEIANAVANKLAQHDPGGSFVFTTSDPAEPAESFSSPNLPLVLGVATLLGLVLAAIAAVVRDRLRRRVTSKVALSDALSAPVLATIAPPRDETSLPALYPGTDASNVFRELRLALEAVATDDPVHKIVVTGVVPGDVNVWLGANLAIALAQVDRRVLLIDGRMGDQHGRPIDAAPDTAGLYDVLQNGGLLQAVSQGPVERLAVLPPGDSGGAPTERIVESRFSTITAEAVNQFDVVIVLAPALSEGQDAVVMAVDGSLLLAIPTGKVTVATLREHAMHLRSVGVRLIGSVLLDPPRPTRGGVTPAPVVGEQVRHVLHVSMPTTEGVARVLLGYVVDQLARGWQVTVACPPTGWLGDEAAAAGATVLAWDAGRAPGPATLAETLRLRRLVHRAGPDVVHLHSAKAGLAGRLAVRRRVRTVYQPHAWSFLAADGLVGGAARAWEAWGSRWTDVLVCVSADEREIGHRAGIRTDVRVVPNGVDLATFAGAPDPVTARSRLGLAEAPTVVCLGRLCRQKGQDRVVALWPDVRRRVPDARLVLVGDGPDRAAVSGREAEGVVVVGAQADPAAWLAAADVVVVPSRWEGMALAPLEAMATARPVVGYDVVGLAESVPPGAGLLVPDGAAEALGVALADRLLDRSLAAAEGAAGRRHVACHHDATRAADALAAAYG